jgi:hypothetical protein
MKQLTNAYSEKEARNTKQQLGQNFGARDEFIVSSDKTVETVAVLI